jgi:hypothetical protein
MIRPMVAVPNFFLDISDRAAKMNTPALPDVNAGVFFFGALILRLSRPDGNAQRANFCGPQTLVQKLLSRHERPSRLK